MINARRKAQCGLVAASFVLAGTLSILAVGSFRQQRALEGAIGTSAASFRLPDAQGQWTSLDSFHGHVVALVFSSQYPGHAVSDHLNVLQQLTDRYASQSNVKVINIVSNTEDFSQQQLRQVQEWAAMTAMRCTTLLDPGPIVSRRYAVGREPAIVVVDASGVIRYRDDRLSADYVSATIDQLLQK